jgi:hypothetical protein
VSIELSLAGLLLLWLFARIAGALIGADATGWIPHLSQALIEAAVRKLPRQHRVRYRDEWVADVAYLRDRPVTALLYACRIRIGVRFLTEALPTPNEPSELRAEVSKSQSTAAEVVEPLLPDAPAAGWYPDPMGKKRLRYWNGERWTEQAAD